MCMYLLEPSVIREDLFKFSRLASFSPKWLLALSDSWNKYLAFLWYMSISVLYKSNQLDATSCDRVLDQREVITTAKDLLIFSVTFSWCCRYFSPRSLLHSSVSIHILYTVLFTFLTEKENLFSNRELLKLVIISFVLVTYTFDSRVTLYGETRSQTLVAVKALITPM